MKNSVRKKISRGRLLLGGAILIWLPLEDINSIFPVLFSLIGATIFSVYNFGKWVCENARMKNLIYGALIGASIPLLSILLMVFKSGLHNHGFSEYPISDIVFLINSFPLALLAGALIGITTPLIVKLIGNNGLG